MHTFSEADFIIISSCIVIKGGIDRGLWWLSLEMSQKDSFKIQRNWQRKAGGNEQMVLHTHTIRCAMDHLEQKPLHIEHKYTLMHSFVGQNRERSLSWHIKGFM